MLCRWVYCGGCGEIYRRTTWYKPDDKKIVWRCVDRIEPKNSTCKSPTILEEELKSAVIKAINKIFLDKTGFIEILKNNITKVLELDFDSEIAETDKEIKNSQKELINLAITNDGYDDMVEKIHTLREYKDNLLLQSAEKSDKLARTKEMLEFLDKQSVRILEYDETLVRKLIEKITVFDEKLLIKFKSGLEVEVKY